MINEQRDGLTRTTMRLANIGRDYWQTKISDIPDDYECKGAIDQYIGSLWDYVRRGVGLVLHGPKGHGKTHIAIGILKRVLLFRGARGLLLPVNRLQEVVIERSVLEWDEDEIPLIERARRANLLVLDDLGEEHSREFSQRQLENLCRYRSVRRRSTIFTTNLLVKRDDNELERAYGDWITSVLKGKNLPVLVRGTDWRGLQEERLKQEFRG